MSKYKRMIIVILCLVITLSCAMAYIIIRNQQREEIYRNAVVLFDDNQFVQAAEMFNSLKYYKDSSEHYDKCIIKIGEEHILNKDFVNAELEFDKIKDKTLKNKMINECQYDHALYLFECNSYTEAKNIFEKLNNYSESNAYLEKCKIALKYNKFDYSGNDSIYSKFYEIYGSAKNFEDYNEAESHLSFAYGKWYGENDREVLISSTEFDGREYGVYAIGEFFNAALIYFYDEKDTMYQIYYNRDYIYGDMISISDITDIDSTVMYSKLTAAESKEAYRLWEEEQAKKPQYADNIIIDKTVAKAREYLSSGYSGAELLYHSLNVENSYVSYDSTTRTYTCNMSIKYSTFVFDVWGTSTNSYDIIAKYRDTGETLVSEGFDMF